LVKLFNNIFFDRCSKVRSTKRINSAWFEKSKLSITVFLKKFNIIFLLRTSNYKLQMASLRSHTTCAVALCNSPKGPEIVYHKFPKDPKLREKWIRACLRKDPVRIFFPALTNLTGSSIVWLSVYSLQIFNLLTSFFVGRLRQRSQKWTAWATYC